MPNKPDQRSIELEFNSYKNCAFYPDSESGLLVTTVVKDADLQRVDLEVLVNVRLRSRIRSINVNCVPYVVACS